MIPSFNQYVLLEYTKHDKKTLTTYMPKKKVKHSCNVALMLRDLHYTRDSYNAALYHDFIERGGSEEELRTTIGNYATDLVLALTKTDTDEDNFDSDNLTLDLLRRKIHKYPEKTRNEIIRIKICDRFDNLRKRRKAGELGKKYLKKSAALLEFLYAEYTGADKEAIRSFILKKVTSKYPTLKLNLGGELVDNAAID